MSATLVNLRWLIQLRWILLGVAGLLLAMVELGSSGLPWPVLSALLGIGAGSNVALQARLGSVEREIPVAAGVLALDVVGITAFLALSGGSNNPFAFLYLLEVTIAALVLPRFVTALFVFGIGVAYASLFTLPQAPHRHEDMQRHLFGMWLAYAVCGPFVALAIHRLRAAVTVAERGRREAELVLQRSERLASLATLAAGAAHEIATPLGTIAVIAGELERNADASVRQDAALLAHEVGRCRDVLSQLSADAGAGSADTVTVVEASRFAAEAVADLARVVVDAEEADGARLRGATRLLRQALRRLVTNGLQAGPEAPVVLRVLGRAETVLLQVEDRGPGLSDDALRRIGEPFYTTRTTGGMGLGVYFARSVAEHAGGTVTFRRGPSGGTIAILTLPRERP